MRNDTDFITLTLLNIRHLVMKITVYILQAIQKLYSTFLYDNQATIIGCIRNEIIVFIGFKQKCNWFRVIFVIYD